MVNLHAITEMEPHLYRLSEAAIAKLEAWLAEQARPDDGKWNDLKVVMWGTLSLIRQKPRQLARKDFQELVYLAARLGFFTGELVVVEDIIDQYPRNAGARLHGALVLAFQAELDKAFRQAQLQSTGNDLFLKAEKLAILSYLHSMRRETLPVMRYFRELESLSEKHPLIRDHVLPFTLIRKNYLLRSEKSLMGQLTDELRELVRSLAKKGHRFYLSKAHLRLGQLLFNQNQLGPAFYHYDQALEQAREIEARHLLSIICNRIGMWYMTQARWTEAKDYFEKALAHAYNSNSEWLTAAPLVNLSQFMWINNHQEEAMESVETFRRIAEKVGDPHDRLIAYNILSQMYEVVGNIELSRRYLRKAMSLVTELDKDD